MRPANLEIFFYEARRRSDKALLQNRPDREHDPERAEDKKSENKSC